MIDTNDLACHEQVRLPDAQASQELHFQMPSPPHVAPLTPKARPPRPPRQDCEPREPREDQETQPTPDQVARSMARALRFQDASPQQALRAQQIVEGRRMAQAEGFSPLPKHTDERSCQIRAGLAACAAERSGRPQGEPQRQQPQRQAQQPQRRPEQAQAADGAPAKKKRHRNRNKGARPAAAPAMH